MNIITLGNYYFKSFKDWLPSIKGSEYPIDIINMPFNSHVTLQAYQPDMEDEGGEVIGTPVGKTSANENNRFQYTIFMPRRKKKADRLILLLHGLNEKNWKKYFAWAHTLTEELDCPVILFPMAYHINRAPGEWSQPRLMQTLSQWQLARNTEIHESSFINAALSYRMSTYPQQFSISGYQSALDITELLGDIRSGRNPYFKEDTHIDIFAYSIGALLAQVLLIANPNNLFNDTNTFLFCGGSAFEDMNGSSKLIMDSQAFDKLYSFYTRELTDELKKNAVYASMLNGTGLGIAFQSMLGENSHKEIREDVFNHLAPRIKAVALEQDKVIPADKIARTLKGPDNKRPVDVEILDFPYKYSHENPFPVGKAEEAELVNKSFDEVFDRAAGFFSRPKAHC